MSQRPEIRHHVPGASSIREGATPAHAAKQDSAAPRQAPGPGASIPARATSSGSGSSSGPGTKPPLQVLTDASRLLPPPRKPDNGRSSLPPTGPRGQTPTATRLQTYGSSLFPPTQKPDNGRSSLPGAGPQGQTPTSTQARQNGGSGAGVRAQSGTPGGVGQGR